MGLFSVSGASCSSRPSIAERLLPFGAAITTITINTHRDTFSLFATHALQMLATTAAASFLALLAFRILVLGET